ncbi:hypothetical protein AVEN_157115-1 [Araneus ventricosus]|uniref:DUF4817 domain-containing protein n=1 Tax=Araneus ventricosus TaxID=182803 RepID=A0A4Y2HHQ0_ARAVE|nr:hypothetical protein AVEN_157115-1 [Araneus ventricosus]
MQSKFRTANNRSPTSRPTIYEWPERFITTGSILPKPKSGRPSRRLYDVKRIQDTFHCSPRKSIRSAAQHLQIPRSTVIDVVHKKLRLYAYKLQLLHELKLDDKPQRRTFAEEMLQKTEDDENFLQSVIFSDEATFHVSGIVNRHNTRIWGLENPHAVLEQARDSRKVSVWCGLLHDSNYRAFYLFQSNCPL